MKKRAIDRSGLDPITRQHLAELDDLAKLDSSGIGGQHTPEGIPNFLSSRAEKVISNSNNSWIVLGRDRVGSRFSGYGGKGDTHAASIDIVAGRMGYLSRKVNEDNEQLWADPDFKKDAARIYLSQKADIDSYFDLAEGSVGNSKTRSAVAIKADAVRIVAREGIKLVTRTDKKNSQGGDVASISGIDLIAGNDDSDLQPLVKGNNLQDALQRMVHHIDKLAGVVDALLHTNMEMNEALIMHFHNSPFFGAPTTPSQVVVTKGTKVMIDQLAKVKKSLVAFKTNLASYKITYLTPAGKLWINSRNNNSN